jgi:hypothetical protein
VFRVGEKKKLKGLNLVPNKQTNTIYLTMADKSLMVLDMSNTERFTAVQFANYGGLLPPPICNDIYGFIIP